MALRNRLCVLSTLFLISLYFHESQAVEEQVNQINQDLFGPGGIENVELGPSVLAIIAIVAGFAVCTHGIQFFKATMFGMGFAVGSLVSYTAMRDFTKDDSQSDTYSWAAFFVGGIVVGLVVLSIFRIGVFMIGAAGGVLLAFFLQTTFLHKVDADHPNTVFYIAIVVLAILGGYLALALQKPVIILATAFFGANACVWGIGYFVGQYPSGANLETLRSGEDVIEVPAAWWYYFAGTILLFLVGLFYQYRSSRRNSSPFDYKA